PDSIRSLLAAERLLGGYSRGGSRLPERIARILTSDEVASRQRAAVLKSAVRLCWSSTASWRDARACLRMLSLAPPTALLPRKASIMRPLSVALGMPPSILLTV